MADMFSGIESMGLSGFDDMDIFGDEKKPGAKEEKPAEKKAAAAVPESAFLFDKAYKCPVCDYEFKEKVLKTGKNKMVSQDFDLRPRYSNVDGIKYGVIVCPFCGYASMSKSFLTITTPQVHLVKEKICTSFTGLGDTKDTYSYDDAIARYKLALVNSVVKRGKISERAYLCLQIAWLLRGKRETGLADGSLNAQTAAAVEAEEKAMLAKACDGIKDSFSKESFPLAGVLDEHTSIYLVAALCFMGGEKDEALRWASRLITSRTANDRIKDRARKIKEMVAGSES